MSFIERIGAPDRMKSWGDPIKASDIDLTCCIEIDEYLRNRCNIPLDIPIWNRQKIDDLIKKIYWRKFSYSLCDVLSKTLPALSLVLFLSYLSDGYIFALYSSMLLLLVAAYFWLIRNKFGKNKRLLSFEEYFSNDISLEQKSNLAAQIITLRQQSLQLLWIGNHETFKLASYVLFSENWFLLFTGIEDDRKGILLTGKIPSGKILIESPTERYETEQENSLPPNARWCPHLRAVQESIPLIRQLVTKGDKQIRSNIIDSAFISQINAYRELKDNSQNWISYRMGKLEQSLKEKLEVKLRTALFPESPSSKKADKLLKDFLKPGNRPFNAYVASLKIVPAKALKKQIRLYHELKK